MSALHRDPVRFSFETQYQQYQQDNGQNNNGRQQQASVQNQRRLVIFGQEKEAQASCAETLLNVCMRPDTAIHPPFLLSEYNLAQ